MTNIGERGLDGGIFCFYFLEEIREFGEGERVEFGHGFACEVPETGFGAVAMARTVGADAVSAVAGEKHADVHFVGFGFEPAEEAADSVPVARIPEFGQGAGAASLAFDDKGLLVGGEFVERNFEWDFAAAAGFFEGLLALFVGVGLPRFDHASCDGELAVGEGEGLIDFDNATEAAAGGAGAEGMVEGEEGWDGFMEIALIAWAEVAVGVEMGMGWSAGEGDGEDSFAVAKAGGDGFGEPRFGGSGEGETILDDEDEEILVGGG